MLVALFIHFFMLNSPKYSWIFPVNTMLRGGGAAVNPAAPK